MKFISGVIFIAFFAAIAEHFMPWWSLAAVCFLAALFIKQGKGRSFLMGFTGIGSYWLAVAMWKDAANEHILSSRMAALFHLPNYGLFILVTVVIGALVGGLSALSGAMLRPVK